MKIHPAANVLPMMADEEFERLRADIQQHGLLSPIETVDGKIIDGRHRYSACKVLGIEPETVEVELNGQSPEEYVWSLNGSRRHLTPSQLAAVAAEIADRIKPKTGRPPKPAEKLSPNGQSKPPDHAHVKAAAMTGASARQTVRAQRVKREAPDVFEQVKQGKLKVTQAEREVKRRAKQVEQKAKAETVKREAPQPTEQIRVVCGDCVQELYKLSGVRLIFADPPYNIGVDYGQGKKADQRSDADYLRWCERWMLAARDALTPDGSLWVMIGDKYADHFGVMLRELGLHRRGWIKWYETFGVNCANNFNRTSRHIFYMVKDPKRFVWTGSELAKRPSDRQTLYNDKRADPSGKYHDDVWEIPRLTDNHSERQPGFPTQLPLEVVRRIVAISAEPGDLVVDPFNGSGTTGVICKELGMRYVGIEASEDYAAAARDRILAS